ncbi:MAG: DMT family transporter [Nitrospiria bacterium]
MTQKNRLGTASLVAAAMIWGGSIVAQKAALQIWNPYFILLVRGGGTLLLIFPYLMFKNQIQPSLLFKDRFRLAGISITGLANSLFVLLGLQYTSAMEAGMIMGSTPILTALMLVSLGKRSLDGRGWLGCVITFLGVVLVVFHPQTGERLDTIWKGDLLVLLGVISWSIYTLLGQEAMGCHSPFFITAITWVGVMFVAPLAFREPRVSQGNLWIAWGALIYIVMAATVFGFFLWLYGLHRVGAAHSTVFLNFIPLSAILFSALLLGESIHWRQWTGGSLILSGAWIVSQVPLRVGGSGERLFGH